MKRATKGFQTAIVFFLGFGWIAVEAPVEAFRMIQQTSTGRQTSGDAVVCNDSSGFVRWHNQTISWRLNTTGQGSGQASALQAAMQSWNNVSGSTHYLSYVGTTTQGFATDGVNTLIWANGNGCTGTCLGLTALVLQTGQRIVESDITFNANYNWAGGIDTQAVATHELGHSLGIHHTNVTTTPRPTMWASYTGTDQRSLEFDDQEALRCTERPFLSFFEGNSGTQDYVCNLDPIKQQINFKNDNRCTNDEARSMRLRNVPAGYFLSVYDDPGCKTTDDWTEIRVYQKTSLHHLISTFEQSSYSSGVQVIHHHNNGLDGKISCIKATICGDQVCEGTESCGNCSADCGPCPYCGDGSCNGFEYCATCAADCGACSCNYNGICEWQTETAASCEADCCDGPICDE